MRRLVLIGLALMLIISAISAENITITPSLTGRSYRLLTQTTAESYASLVTNNGNTKNATSDTTIYLELLSNATDTSLYYRNDRPEIRYQIPAGIHITAATLALTGGSKSNTFAGTAWELLLVNNTWKISNQIDASDYQNISRIQMNTANISYASLASASPYQNNFSLNAMGVQYLNDRAGGQVSFTLLTSWDFNQVMGGTPGTGKSTTLNINATTLPNPPILVLTYDPPPPTASFIGSVFYASIPATATFTDTSIGSPTGWQWDFGDGDTTNATAQNPIHTYTNYGTYSVTLNASNDYGYNVSPATSVTVREVSLLPNFTKSTGYFNTGSGRYRTVNLSITDPNASTCMWLATNQTVYIGSQPGGNGTEFVFNTTSCSPRSDFGSGNWSIRVNITNATTGGWNLSSAQIMKGLSLAGHVFNTGTDHVYNYDISALPLDPKSPTYITNAAGPTAWIAPNFYPNFNTVDSRAPTSYIGYSEYTWTDPFMGPIPWSDGWLINDFDVGIDPYCVGGSGHDCGFSIINVETGDYYEGYRASQNLTVQGTWDAKTSVHGITNDYTLRGYGMTGWGLSGLKETPLVATYDELVSDNVSHALAMLVPYPGDQNTYVWPVNVPGVIGNTNYPPLGTRFRLNATKDLSTCNPYARTLLNATKKYGSFVVDQTGASPKYISFMVERATATGNPVLSGFGTSAFACVNFSDFEAVDESMIASNVTSAQVNTNPPIPSFTLANGVTLIDASLSNLIASSLPNFTQTFPQWKYNNSAIEHTYGTQSILYNAGRYSDGDYSFDVTRMNNDPGYDRSQFVFCALNTTPMQYNYQDEYSLIFSRPPNNQSQIVLFKKGTLISTSVTNPSWFTPYNITHINVSLVTTPTSAINVYADGVLALTSYDNSYTYGYFGFSYIDTGRVSQFSNLSFSGKQAVPNSTAYSDPFNANFLDASTRGPTIWNWLDNGVVFSQIQNPVQVLRVGNHPIQLAVGNIFGTNTSDILWINVSAYSWDFGDGTTSTDQNPQHTYTTAGTYTVNLTVCNIDGCNTNSKIAYITANPDVSVPVAGFTRSRDVVRFPGNSTVFFSDTSTNTPTSWDWYFSDGTANVTGVSSVIHHYSKRGLMNACLIAGNAAGKNTACYAIRVLPG